MKTYFFYYLESINSEQENDEESTKLLGKNTFIEVLDEKIDDNLKGNMFFEDRLTRIEKKLNLIEENLQQKILNLKEKKKEMSKSLQIIEKIDQQKSQSDEDLNLIWKTLNTIVLNSKNYFEDVKKEMERKIHEFKLDITGLLNFDEVRDIVEILKTNNIEKLMTQNKFETLFNQQKKEVQELINLTTENKFNEISKNHKKLNDLIEREKFFYFKYFCFKHYEGWTPI